jgi:hypothetical protein
MVAGDGYAEGFSMVSKTVLTPVVAVGMGMILWFFLSGNGSSSSLGLSEATVTPTPCPPIEYEVVVSVPASEVKVGETFVLHSSSSGFAGLAQTRLYIEYRAASVPELAVVDPVPMIEVLPDSTGSDLGTADFVLRALKPGTVRLSTEIYGDAYFYSVGCHRGTEFKLVRSEPVTVSIEPEKSGTQVMNTDKHRFQRARNKN